MEEIVTIRHADFETPLILNEECVQVLIVENPSLFFRYVGFLDCQIQGEHGEFVFTQVGKEISPEKTGAIICDPFHFDLNDKRILNLLYKRAGKIGTQADNILKLNEVNAKITAYFSELFCALPFSLSYDEVSTENLLKSTGVCFEKNYESLLEKYVCYINTLIELKDCRFVVLVNLKSVLDDESLLQLYRHCRLEKIGLLLLESSKIRPLLSCERSIIITEDLCEIVENYQNL